MKSIRRLLVATGIAVAGTCVLNGQMSSAEAQIYVPNDNLERYLIQQGFDSGELDDYVPYSSAQRITKLDLSNMDINSLTGIEQFSNLAYLDISGNDELTSYQLTGENKNLKTIKAVGSKMQELVVYSSGLENVDFSNNRNLTRLDILGARLKSLNLTGTTKLKYMWINGGSLASVDLSSQTELYELRLTSNKLSSINLTPLTKLTRLELTGNRLSSIDLSKNSSLELLFIGNNRLTSLDITKNPGLQSLVASSNNLSSIDLTSNARLSWINLADNELSSIVLPNSSYLSSLTLSGNKLTQLDVTNSPELFNLNVSANRIAKLDLSNNPQLTGLNVAFNPARQVKLPSDISNLMYLDVSATKIKRLDLRGANLTTNTTYNNDYWRTGLYEGGGLQARGLWSHDTKITLVVDNPPLVRADAGHSIDEHVKLVRK
jgi:hypothetical protein